MANFFLSLQLFWLYINYDKLTQLYLKWIAVVLLMLSAISLSISTVLALLPITFLGVFIAHSFWTLIAQANKGLFINGCKFGIFCIGYIWNDYNNNIIKINRSM